MKDAIFGEVVFDIGWKAERKIILFGIEYNITLKIKAYRAEDGITEEQREAYKKYTANQTERLARCEQLLIEYSSNPQKQFVPIDLLFERDGSYALLCNDNEEPDEGIAICLSPSEVIMLQDDYL